MRSIPIILLLCALAFPAAGQRRDSQRQDGRSFLEELSGRNRFSWEYDADFHYIFDNREFAYSDDAWIPSGTMHTLVFAPTVGFSIQQSRRVHHRLTAGVEFAHDMGSHTWADLAREPLLFYDVHVQARRGVFEALAGIFPRRYMEGIYSEAFFTGMFRNNDRNLEGLLLKWRAQRFYTELGLDWMGKYGPQTRERFQIVSAGQWHAAWWFSLGWTGSFFHYACSGQAQNVVDNHLLEPWLKMDFSRRTSWQELSAQLGGYVGYQRNRIREAQPRLPFGGELKLTARRWGVMLQNTTYFGGNLMPYFRDTDPAGLPYATNLYFGSPFYEGFHDLAELAWTPQLTHYLSLRLAARAYFGAEGFRGWQQICSLRLSLDALRHRDTALGRCL